MNLAVQTTDSLFRDTGFSVLPNPFMGKHVSLSLFQSKGITTGFILDRRDANGCPVADGHIIQPTDLTAVLAVTQANFSGTTHRSSVQLKGFLNGEEVVAVGVSSSPEERALFHDRIKHQLINRTFFRRLEEQFKVFGILAPAVSPESSRLDGSTDLDAIRLCDVDTAIFTIDMAINKYKFKFYWDYKGPHSISYPVGNQVNDARKYSLDCDHSWQLKPYDISDKYKSTQESIRLLLRKKDYYFFYDTGSTDPNFILFHVEPKSDWAKGLFNNMLGGSMLANRF